ncbi:hypothetical protein D3C78_1584450 [compost metagenome]
MTNWNGKPSPVPGRDGRLKPKICNPGMLSSLACTSGRIAICVRLRSSHGLSRKPPMPDCTPLKPLIWNDE